MSGSPRTLFAAVLLMASCAVGGCSAESTSSHADTDAASDSGPSSAHPDEGSGRAGGSGKDADDNAQTTAPPDESADDADDEDGGDSDGADGGSALREDAANYLRDAARALQEGGNRDSMRDTATGAALDAALAQAAEFDDNGWHQVGVPRVVSARVVKDRRDDDPPRVTISACVDSSAVDVVDASGASVRHGSHAERSRMIYTLVRKRGDWLVERESFPNDPEC